MFFNDFNILILKIKRKNLIYSYLRSIHHTIKFNTKQKFRNLCLDKVFLRASKRSV